MTCLRGNDNADSLAKPRCKCALTDILHPRVPVFTAFSALRRPRSSTPPTLFHLNALMEPSHMLPWRNHTPSYVSAHKGIKTSVSVESITRGSVSVGIMTVSPGDWVSASVVIESDVITSQWDPIRCRFMIEGDRSDQVAPRELS